MNHNEWPQFEYRVITEPHVFPSRKPCVEMEVECFIPGAGDNTGSRERNLGGSLMRRLKATVAEFPYSGDMVLIGEDLFICGCEYKDRVTFNCRLYTDKAKDVESARTDILDGLKAFIDSLNLKKDTKSQVGAEIIDPRVDGYWLREILDDSRI